MPEPNSLDPRTPRCPRPARDRVWYAAMDILISSRTRRSSSPRSGQLMVTWGAALREGRSSGPEAPFAVSPLDVQHGSGESC